MTLIIPNVFKQDIMSSNTQIFPKVQIHTEAILGFDLYLSTNKLDFDGFFWKPLLLKIPTVKEKFDIETKKFIVSKLNLVFSNAKYEDGRMSDILGQTGLLNIDITLSYQSQSAKTQDDCLVVFKGNIRRVNHDAEKLTLEVHDPGSFYHRDLPQLYLDNLVGSSQGKPVPINYGEQEYAPSVVQRATGGGYLVHFDTCPHYQAMNAYMETSLKTTTTQQYVGSIYGETGFWCNVSNGGFAPMQIFINGKYGRVGAYTRGAFGPSESNVKGYPSDHEFNTSGDAKKQVNYIGTSADFGGVDINYDTDTYYRIYNTWYLTNYNLLQCLWTHKPDDFNIERQSGNGTLELEEWRPDNFGATLVKQATNGNYLEPAWTGDISNTFTTPSSADDAEGMAVSGAYHGEFLMFRVPIGKFTFSTDTGTDWERVNLQYIYMGGLVVPRTHSPPPGGRSGIFLEWNDVRSQQVDAGDYFIGTAYEDAGAWNDDYMDNADGYTTAYDGNTLRTGGSIALQPDLGHPDLNIPISSSAGYVRELFSMAGWQGNDAHQGTYYGTVVESSSQRANNKYIQPSFEFQAGHVNNKFTLGWARQWLTTEQQGEFICEWFQEFTHTEHLGQTVTNTSFAPMIRQIDICTWTHQKNPFQHPFVVNNKGRRHMTANNPGHQGTWSNGHWIQNPVDIIRHLIEFELHFYSFDAADYSLALGQHSGWEFSCCVDEKINSKDLIEDLAKSTKMFPKFGVDGTFRFNTIKDSYSVSDYDSASLIDSQEVIKFKFSLTKIEDVCSRVEVNYRWDFHNKAYSKKLDDVCQLSDNLTNWSSFYSFIVAWGNLAAPPSGMQFVDHTETLRDSADNPIMTDEQLAYYNFDIADDHVLKHETKYITDWEHTYTMWGDWNTRTAQKLRLFLFQQFRNQHLVFTLKLPLKYLYLDVGDIIKMEKLIAKEMGAYGINYTKLDNLNGQYRYPLFFITGVNKSIDYIEITAFQLHFIGEDADLPESTDWQAIVGDDYEAPTVSPTFSNTGIEDLVISGCTDPDASNYQSWANTDDGSCTYPVYGCTDPNATNYNPDADIDNNSCEYVMGCTNQGALNYNPEAHIDDGSCILEYPAQSKIQFSGRVYVVEDATPEDDIWLYSTTRDLKFVDFTLGGEIEDVPDFNEVHGGDIISSGFQIPLGDANSYDETTGFNFIFGEHRWFKAGVQIVDWLDLFTVAPQPGSIEDGYVMMSIRIGPDDYVWDNYADTIQTSWVGTENNLESANIVPPKWYGVYTWELKVRYTDPENTTAPGAYATWELVSERLGTNTLGTYYSNPNAGEYLTVPINFEYDLDAFPILIDKTFAGSSNTESNLGGSGWNDLSYMASYISIDIGTGVFLDPTFSGNYHEYADDVMIEYNPIFSYHNQGTIGNPVEEDTGGAGDVNLDGDVNILDVVLMVNIILSDDLMESASDEQIIQMDVNQDGGVNVLDVVTLVQLILGNIS